MSDKRVQIVHNGFVVGIGWLRHYQVKRERMPVYVMGSPNPRSWSVERNRFVSATLWVKDDVILSLKDKEFDIRFTEGDKRIEIKDAITGNMEYLVGEGNVIEVEVESRHMATRDIEEDAGIKVKEETNEAYSELPLEEAF